MIAGPSPSGSARTPDRRRDVAREGLVRIVVEARKRQLDDALCGRLDAAIAIAFAFDVADNEHPVIKAADRRALVSEAQVLLHDGGRAMLDAKGVSEGERLAARPATEPSSPERAREEFLARHRAAVSTTAPRGSS